MMADPMADLGGSGLDKKDNQSLTTTKEVADPLVLGTNLQRIDRIRSVMGIASGCVAGIGGLTGMVGFCKSDDESCLLSSRLQFFFGFPKIFRLTDTNLFLFFLLLN